MVNEFFDEVYVVSLLERQDRRDIIKCELDKQGIPFTFFDAVKEDNGILGLVKSMQQLFSLALSKGQERILVLEDDNKFLIPNVKSFLREVMPQLPKDYFTFHLGLNLLTQPTRISENILKVNQSYSTHAIGYQRKSMELILQMLGQVELTAYDIFLRDNIQTYGKSYCTFPMIATQRTNFSDIEGKITNWHDLMVMTYSMHTKNLNSMPAETTPCFNGHLIDGQIPSIDPSKFELQHPELIGRICDCKSLIYQGEEECGCAIKEWRIKWGENYNR